MTLVKRYLAFKYHTDKDMILREFTYGVVLAMGVLVGSDARLAAGRHRCAGG